MGGCGATAAEEQAREQEQTKYLPVRIRFLGEREQPGVVLARTRDDTVPQHKADESYEQNNKHKCQQHCEHTHRLGVVLQSVGVLEVFAGGHRCGNDGVDSLWDHTETMVLLIEKLGLANTQEKKAEPYNENHV